MAECNETIVGLEMCRDIYSLTMDGIPLPELIDRYDKIGRQLYNLALACRGLRELTVKGDEARIGYVRRQQEAERRNPERNGPRGRNRLTRQMCVKKHGGLAKSRSIFFILDRGKRDMIKKSTLKGSCSLVTGKQALWYSYC